MSVDSGPGKVSAYLAQMDNPDELDHDPGHLMACTDFNEFPHRHPTRLREAYEKHGSISRTAEALGSCHSAVARWLHVYGIREYQPHTGAAFLERLDPDDVGAD